VEVAVVVAGDAPRPDVEGHRPHAKTELEPERVELVGCVVMDTLDIPGSGEQLLRQRRSVVGGMALVAHDDDGATVAEVADLLCRPQTGQRGPHDHDGCVSRKGLAHRPNMVIHCSGVRRRKT
jgi:hypothetical protein